MCQPELDNLLPEGLRPATRHALILASADAKSTLHRSPAGWYAWHFLVLGRARWRFFAPSVPLESLKANIHGLGAGVSEVDAFAVAGEHNVGFAPQEMWEGEQEAGEVMVIPAGWWCQVLYIERSITAVSQWVPDVALEHSLEIAVIAAGFARLDTMDAAVVGAEVSRRGFGRPDRNAIMLSALLGHSPQTTEWGYAGK
eukprot:gnl/TRDRNA2_/TRDRNA2_73747_c0_seq1.p1 gnl/TRDRNA2_/TRDRNA2_73747_c0~~gnl/TRDRNA2_/TRDRNA2_73747_c0_seq1.p1  ORF type:complete len:225 (-),score=28.29 gnl/TRDRNA2_/TRDRNA2_73747_c0_seq1:264-860(-)